MSDDILFETSRFNLSEVWDHFINPCCFGEDLAAWLWGRLHDKGIKVTEPDQEDWGWYIEAEYEGASYSIGIGGNADEFGENRNQGEWRVMVEKRRSLWEKVTRRGERAGADEMSELIREVIEAEPDIKNVRYEDDTPSNRFKQKRD